MCNRGIST
ncbi:hypothetical protein F383_36509 [Gossypium arboreum]|uniref:Uncharacterized protein n=1 Tax=Gossypium arboreum TaxID=29729 RepID=A0A0B0PZH9_GOSAR|nr:hypothetical protein F383_36509 [Gossypium arboreum]